MCRSLDNPAVKAATAAAGGTLTPQSCVPVIDASWSPGSSIVTVEEKKALTDNSTCSCKWAGSVSIESSASQIDVDG
jgi:hypothetical protein